jgi:flagellar capping protein FliD
MRLKKAERHNLLASLISEMAKGATELIGSITRGTLQAEQERLQKEAEAISQNIASLKSMIEQRQQGLDAIYANAKQLISKIIDLINELVSMERANTQRINGA